MSSRFLSMSQPSSVVAPPQETAVAQSEFNEMPEHQTAVVSDQIDSIEQSSIRLERATSLRPDGASSRSDQNPAQKSSSNIQLCAARERVLTTGWCPHQVQYLRKRFDDKVVTYLKSLERTQRGSRSHAACHSQPKCVALNIDFRTYETRHLIDGCPCTMLDAPYSDLVEIIDKDEIPLIALRERSASSDDVVIEFRARQDGDVYTAISHVWADGLGNPSENALPECQLKALKGYLDQFEHPFEVSGLA